MHTTFVYIEERKRAKDDHTQNNTERGSENHWSVSSISAHPPTQIRRTSERLLDTE